MATDTGFGDFTSAIQNFGNTIIGLKQNWDAMNNQPAQSAQSAQNAQSVQVGGFSINPLVVMGAAFAVILVLVRK
jgi:hypothetical protein